MIMTVPYFAREKTGCDQTLCVETNALDISCGVGIVGSKDGDAAHTEKLLHSNRAVVNCTMKYPVRWNDLHVWKYDVHFDDSQIYHQMHHQPILTHLSTEWSEALIISKEESKLSHFVPMNQYFRFTFSRSRLFLNINPANMSSFAAGLNGGRDCFDSKHNAHCIFHFPWLESKVFMPGDKFNPSSYSMTWSVRAEKGLWLPNDLTTPLSRTPSFLRKRGEGVTPSQTGTFVRSNSSRGFVESNSSRGFKDSTKEPVSCFVTIRFPKKSVQSHIINTKRSRVEKWGRKVACFDEMCMEGTYTTTKIQKKIRPGINTINALQINKEEAMVVEKSTGTRLLTPDRVQDAIDRDDLELWLTAWNQYNGVNLDITGCTFLGCPELIWGMLMLKANYAGECTYPITPQDFQNSQYQNLIARTKFRRSFFSKTGEYKPMDDSETLLSLCFHRSQMLFPSSLSARDVDISSCRTPGRAFNLSGEQDDTIDKNFIRLTCDDLEVEMRIVPLDFDMTVTMSVTALHFMERPSDGEQFGQSTSSPLLGRSHGRKTEAKKRVITLPSLVYSTMELSAPNPQYIAPVYKASGYLHLGHIDGTIAYQDVQTLLDVVETFSTGMDIMPCAVQIAQLWKDRNREIRGKDVGGIQGVGVKPEGATTVGGRRVSAVKSARVSSGAHPRTQERRSSLVINPSQEWKASEFDDHVREKAARLCYSTFDLSCEQISLNVVSAGGRKGGAVSTSMSIEFQGLTTYQTDSTISAIFRNLGRLDLPVIDVVFAVENATVGEIKFDGDLRVINRREETPLSQDMQAQKIFLETQQLFRSQAIQEREGSQTPRGLKQQEDDGCDFESVASYTKQIRKVVGSVMQSHHERVSRDSKLLAKSRVHRRRNTHKSVIIKSGILSKQVMRDMDTVKSQYRLQNDSFNSAYKSKWRRRMFSLNGTCLYYYKHTDPSRIRGEYFLNAGTTVSKLPSDLRQKGDKHRFGFKIHFFDGEDEDPKDPLCLCASTQKECEEWINDIQHAIDIERKKTPQAGTGDNASKTPAAAQESDRYHARGDKDRYRARALSPVGTVKRHRNSHIGQISSVNPLQRSTDNTHQYAAKYVAEIMHAAVQNVTAYKSGGSTPRLVKGGHREGDFHSDLGQRPTAAGGGTPTPINSKPSGAGGSEKEKMAYDPFPEVLWFPMTPCSSFGTQVPNTSY
jgi:hypothetical protein